MAIINEDKAFISIGASCVVEENLSKYFNKRCGSIFDFIITDIESTVQALNTIANDDLLNIFFDMNNYKIKYVPGYGDKIFHKSFSFLYLKHEKEINDNFINKIKHLIYNFKLASSTDRPVFIWSNAQGNLDMVCQVHNIKIEDFYLTEKKYNIICDTVKNNFGGIVFFIVRQEYVNLDIQQYSNIFVVDIEKGDDHSNIFGNFDDFKNILDHIIAI